jgi:hypothetical protein
MEISIVKKKHTIVCLAYNSVCHHLFRYNQTNTFLSTKANFCMLKHSFFRELFKQRSVTKDFTYIWHEARFKLEKVTCCRGQGHVVSQIQSPQ